MVVTWKKEIEFFFKIVEYRFCGNYYQNILLEESKIYYGDLLYQTLNKKIIFSFLFPGK